ncbi:MAG: response regulator transcription factor [Actinobacteria bacterium]|nr:response regulator transcription factor [Actinomycetota bacterium]
MSQSEQSVRVVLADDEQLVLDGLSAVLESDPRIRVVGRAVDGAALLHLVGKLAPDVALLSVRLPGLGRLSELRGLRPDPPPYCALLNPFDLDAYVDAALEAGAHGFLFKDCPPDVLVRAVHDLASGGAVIDPRIAVRLLPRLRSVPADNPTAELSDRERDVLALLGEGASNAAIGRSLSISESTVKGHVTRLLVKLGVRNRVQAALVARGLWDPAS